MSLRVYQRAAAKATLAHLIAGRSPLLVAPTGSGKTVIAASVAEHFRSPLIVAHRREIVDQARRIFGRHCRARSIQSFATHKVEFQPDLLIIDEAHRAAASTYRELIEQYPAVPRLGLTATPLRTDGRGLCDAFSDLVECPGVRGLIESGHLVPYRALEAPDDALRQLAWMKRVGGDYDSRDLAALMNTPRLVGDVVREYKKHAEGRTAVVFAVSIEHSKALAEAMNNAGVRAAHIDGRAAEHVRQSALSALAHRELDVLCNVNLFTEGWDCPPVSCVVMARPTASLTLYLQSVGRGMRPAEGKADLLILDHAGNMQRHGYPDVEREWSLESPGQRAKREEDEREIARLAALGFDSVEAELEEKQRILSESYSVFQVIELLQYKGSRSALRTFLDNRGIKSTFGKHRTGPGNDAVYLKSEIDNLIQRESSAYSSEEAAKVLGIQVNNVNRFLASRGVYRYGSLKSQGTRYLKQEVDGVKSLIESCYTAKEVAARLGLKREGIRGQLKRLGIIPAAYDCYPKNEVDRLISDYPKYCTTAEAEKILGVKHVNVFLKRFGIVPVARFGSCNTRYDRAAVDALKCPYGPHELCTTSEVIEIVGTKHLTGFLRRFNVHPVPGYGGINTRYIRAEVEAAKRLSIERKGRD